MKNRILIEAVLIVIAFLIGFKPQSVATRHLQNELQVVWRENAWKLRDLAALTYVQASQKNYGLAFSSSAKFFSRAREFVGLRDRVTTELAAGTPRS